MPRLLVNRVDRQVNAAISAFQAAGFQAFGLPCERIEPQVLLPAQAQWIADLDQFAHVVLTSPTAADCFDEMVANRWVQWPLGVRLWAVGPGTAAAYRGDGPCPECPEHGVGAAALMATLSPVQQPSDRILVVTGDTGGEAFDALPNVSRLALFSRVPQCPIWPSPETWTDNDLLVHGSERLLMQAIRCFGEAIPAFWQMTHVITNTRAISHLHAGTRYYLVEAPVPEAVQRALAEDAAHV